MKASIVLLLAGTALLAAGARADSPGEPEALLKKVQEFAQKAVAMVKSALSTVQESEGARQARQWLADKAELAKQRLSQLWTQTPAS